MRLSLRLLAGALLAAASCTSTARASEGGGGVYQNGAEGLTAAALPPPGTYLLAYLEDYTADRFNDSQGHAGLMSDFHANATAIVPRLVQVDRATFLGATIGHAMMVPMINMVADADGIHGHKTGFGDVTVTPLILGWHIGRRLHIMVTSDFNVPVGTYSRTNPANFARHYWNAEPIATLAWYSPRGFTVDLKAMYDINGANHDGTINGFNPTGASYRSGQEFHLDYAVAQKVGGWQLGIAGYYYRQTTADRIDNAAAQATIDSLGGFEGRVFAAGPTIHRAIGRLQVIGSWQHEFFADDRPQGERFWIKLILPITRRGSRPI